MKEIAAELRSDLTKAYEHLDGFSAWKFSLVRDYLRRFPAFVEAWNSMNEKKVKDGKKA